MPPPLALSAPTAACDQKLKLQQGQAFCVFITHANTLRAPQLLLLLLLLLLLHPRRAAASHMQFWLPTVDAMCERVVLKTRCFLCTVLRRFEVAGFNLI